MLASQGNVGLAAAVITLAASGTNARIQVVGIALTTIDWDVRGISYKFTP